MGVPHLHVSPSPELILEALSEAGLDEPRNRVGVCVDRVEQQPGLVRAFVRVLFDVEHPMCCAMLGCYLPAFTPHGLAKAADLIRRSEFLADNVALELVVQHHVPDSFRFDSLVTGEDGNIELFRST